jgi:hypothetical protein
MILVMAFPLAFTRALLAGQTMLARCRRRITFH